MTRRWDRTKAPAAGPGLFDRPAGGHSPAPITRSHASATRATHSVGAAAGPAVGKYSPTSQSARVIRFLQSNGWDLDGIMITRNMQLGRKWTCRVSEIRNAIGDRGCIVCREWIETDATGKRVRRQRYVVPAEHRERLLALIKPG